MASLRTAFIETINPAKYPFFAIVPWFHVPACQISNSDDIKKESKGTNLVNKSTSPKIPPCLRPTKNIQNPNFKVINRVLNQNINNFSQLLDGNSNDFKDCQNFVHVLQLDQNEDEEFKLSELDTVKSMSACGADFLKKSRSSYIRADQKREEDEGDFSQVEDFSTHD